MEFRVLLLSVNVGTPCITINQQLKDYLWALDSDGKRKFLTNCSKIKPIQRHCFICFMLPHISMQHGTFLSLFSWKSES